MKLKTLSPQVIKNKQILVRVDYNVPLKNGEIKDEKRIDISIQTINYLFENGASKVILMSHLGRPKKAENDELTAQTNSQLSLKQLVPTLEKKLQQKVGFFPNMDLEPKNFTEFTSNEKVVLLENLRFHAGEKKDDHLFAKQLAELADIYVNDAFSTSHRAHVSVSAISEILPSFAGFSLQKEVEMLSKLTKDPKRPFVLIVGGAKISDKVSAIENLAKIADTVLVGGGVANNFLKAEGFDIAKSYLQDVPADMAKDGVNFVDFANELLDENKQEQSLIDGYLPLPKIIYPVDVMVARSPDSETAKEVNLLDPDSHAQYRADEMFLDIGPKTIKLFSKVIANAKTIFWNGPMGVFENKSFSRGTNKIAHAVSSSNAETILGGGDTISAAKEFNLEDKYTYLSAAGGASLDFLSGKDLPGLKNLFEK